MGCNTIMKNVLLIEDNFEENEHFSKILREAGYTVVSTTDVVSALALVEQLNYDLIITDLNLGDKSGFDILNELKNKNIEVKVLVVTGSENPEDEIKSLGMGVDEFISKPINKDVFLIRIKKILKNIHVNVNILYSEYENIRIETKRRKVFKNDKEILLTRTEYELIKFFLQNKSRVVTREEILFAIWGENKKELYDDRTINVHINNVRKKLGITAVVSVRGVGYEWIE